MKSRITVPALALAALFLVAAQAQAVLPHQVKCANGSTVTATDSQSDVEACLTVGSRPGATNRPGGAKHGDVTLKRSPADEAKARKYERLAAQHKPRTAETERLVKEYMRLPPARRSDFKAANPQVQKSIWDYAPYAVCFYASVAGGADVVEAGDDCHSKWVE